jgi:hypothetical protein
MRLPIVITTSVSPDDLDPRILDETHCTVLPLVVTSFRGGQASKPIAKPTRSMTRRR